MIFNGTDKVRLTKSELNELRTANARQGLAINDVRTFAQLLNAAIGGLDPELRDDLQMFLETGSSPLTQGTHPDHPVAMP